MRRHRAPLRAREIKELALCGHTAQGGHGIVGPRRIEDIVNRDLRGQDAARDKKSEEGEPCEGRLQDDLSSPTFIPQDRVQDFSCLIGARRGPSASLRDTPP